MKRIATGLFCLLLTAGLALGVGAENKVVLKEDSDTLLLVEGYEDKKDSETFDLDTEDFTQGEASAKKTAVGVGAVLTDIERVYEDPIDLSAYGDNDDAYVYFNLYLEDASLFNRNQDTFIEFSSGGFWGSQIAQYNLGLLTDLQDGWNEVYLPITSFVPHADESVGVIDWSKVNYIRMYMFHKASDGLDVEQTAGIDGLYVGLSSDFDTSALPEPTEAPTTQAPTTTAAPQTSTTKAGGGGDSVDPIPFIIVGAVAAVVIIAVVVAVVIRKRKK